MLEAVAQTMRSQSRIVHSEDTVTIPFDVFRSYLSLMQRLCLHLQLAVPDFVGWKQSALSRRD